MDEMMINDSNNVLKTILDQLQQVSDQKQAAAFRQLLDVRNAKDVLVYVDIFNAFYKSKLGKTDEDFTAFWVQLCNLIVAQEEENQLQANTYFYLFVYSILMALAPDSKYTAKYLSLAKTMFEEDPERLIYIVNQLTVESFHSGIVLDEDNRMQLNHMYETACNSYIGAFQKYLKPLNQKMRYHNRVIVFSVQFLSEDHPPTRSTLERCKALKALGKEVYLISTSERYVITQENFCPLYFTSMGSYEQEYEGQELYDLKGENGSIWFRHLSNQTPLAEKILEVLNWVYEIRPEYMLCIGPDSVVADVCGTVIPCASMGVVFSSLPRTLNKMKILGRNMKNSERKQYEELGYDVIESRFTFELKEQTQTFHRSQFNIPDSAFCLVIVGTRLHDEVSTEFLQMLNSLCEKDCYVVFAGYFDGYETLVGTYENIKKHGRFIGYCDDILALMEVCDLYVNPLRSGGGFSIIEAFKKGKPGVYVDMGDVATAGGEEFKVNDLNEMRDRIIHYKNDTEFYQLMSKKALDRAALMTDSIAAMKRLDDAIVKRVDEIYW